MPTTSPTDQRRRTRLPIDLRRVVRNVVASIAMLYLGIIVVLMASESRLVYPAPKYPMGDWEGSGLDFVEVPIQSADGTQLVGCFLNCPHESGDAPRRTVLLLHGNAENAAMAAKRLGMVLQDVLNADVLVLDYRGYGKSEGTPDEAGILADAEAGLAWLNKRTKTKPEDVIVVGHSLGGGPACYLASRYPLKMLVLQRTFTSLPDVAAETYGWIPVHWLMRNRYPNLEWVSQADCPLFQSHGDCDGVVPFEQGQRLFRASRAKLKRFYVLEKQGHYAPYDDKYWEELYRFVDEVD